MPPVGTTSAADATFAVDTTQAAFLAAVTAPGVDTDAGFGSGGRAIGGNVFGSDIFGDFLSGDIIVTAVDAAGTSTQTIVAATTSSFRGVVSMRAAPRNRHPGGCRRHRLRSRAAP